jgi:hypothetical protein
MVPLKHALAQQLGVPAGQQAPFPLSTVPDGQHTGAPDAVTTIRDVAQHRRRQRASEVVEEAFHLQLPFTHL